MSRTEPAGDPARRRLPRLRHDAARRRPARGDLVLGGRQARRRPPPGRAGRRASSRVAGPGRCPRTPSSSPGPRRGSWSCSTPRWSRSAPPARRARRPPQDPQVRALLDSAGAGRHAGREVRPAAHRAGAAHRRGRELRDGRRHRRVPARRGPAGVPRRRALLRRLRASTPTPRCACSTPAVTAGADVAVLCDTNGGMLPLGLAEVVAEVAARTGFRLGIHCQDDTGCAVANSVAAVQAGATHVQCTANGYGERAGNADLFAVVGNLVTKLGMPVLPDGRLGELTRTSHALAEIANIAPDTHQAYVGTSAFAHKAGLHASAIKVDPELYNHMNPVDVGNGQRVLVTEMAGRASVELKGSELGLDLAGHPDAVSSVVATGQGARGARAGRSRPPTPRWSCCMRSALGEAATAPVRARVLPGDHRAPGRRARGRARRRSRSSSTGSGCSSTAEGNGPVNALDAALRAALAPSCPWLADVALSDYKVRILRTRGTDAVTRVLVESTDRADGAGGPSGPRSACTATSSRRRGWRSSTRSPTPPSAAASRPPDPRRVPVSRTPSLAFPRRRVLHSRRGESAHPATASRRV